MKLLYFAWLRAKIGTSEETVELPAEVAVVLGRPQQPALPHVGLDPLEVTDQVRVGRMLAHSPCD